MAEVNAATETMAKNSTPNRVPNGICWKASGRLMKISPGPAPGLMPLAKITGKIARPASSATQVSAMATTKVVRAIDWPSGR
ncbi:hypothetical protein D3C86_1995110 [compost metagenome]